MDKISCSILFALGCTFSGVVCANDLLRDPTQPMNYVPVPSVSQSVVQSGYRLSAVFLGVKPIAVINGKRCYLGDEIDGLTITKITPNGVVLEKGTEHKILKMFRSDIIK